MASWCEIHSGLVAHLAKLRSARAGQRFADALVQLGYLEPAKPYHDGERTWKSTDAGRRLATATGRRPIHRATADRLLAGLVDRIGAANANPAFLLSVTQAVVFGSYVRGADRLSDLDIAIRLEWRERDPERRWELRQQSIHAAQEAGRQFQNISEMYGWSRTEVRRYIGARSPTISLHDLAEDWNAIERSGYRVIYGSPDVQVRRESEG